MSLLGQISSLFLLTVISSSSVLADCESYGVDFQNYGTYFQNVSSSDPFTFVQYFEGCQPDNATNILIDPSGTEYQCSDTPLTPDDCNELSICPIDKCELFSGPWSVIITSNNGDAAPIAYQRDFSLVVGPPSTTTYTPTITVVYTTTPIYTITITTASTAFVTATQTIVSPLVTLKPTTTLTPPRVTKTVTKTTTTITLTAVNVTASISVVTYTKTCSFAPSQTSPDPTASVTPTLLTRRSELGARDILKTSEDREAWLEERHNALARAERLRPRGLDSSMVTVTDSSTADFFTSTVTVPANMTISVNTTAEITVFSTRTSTTTLLSGTTTMSQVTVTAPTPTKTKTKKVLGLSTTTTMQTVIVTITKSTAPAASSKQCVASGGKMV